MAALRVQVVEGNAWEPSRTFAPGVAVGPLGLGREAEWVIDAPGAAPLHAYLYFDGTSLFVATAQGDVPTTLNGAAASQAWTQVMAPSEIRLGGARLLVSEMAGLGPPRVSHDDDGEDPASVTKLQPLPPSAMPGSTPGIMEDVATSFFVQRPPAHPAGAPPVAAPMPAAGRRSAAAPIADDSTKFLPIEQMRKDAEAAAPAPLPAAGSPYRPPAVHAESSPLSSLSPPSPASPPSPYGPPSDETAPLPSALAPRLSPDATQPASALGPPPQAAAPAGGSALVKAWKSATPPRKALFFLLPIALAGFVFTMLPTKEVRPPRAATPAARSSASASASADAPPMLAPATSASPADLVTGPLLAPPAPAAPSSTVKGRSPKPPVPTTAVEKTTERKAVDALADGNFVEALRLYDQLATEHPEVPAYREAARILRATAETSKKP